MNNYLLINVSGKNIYRFILKCKNNNINLFNIKNISYKEIIIKININDYNKVKKINGYKYKLLDAKGIINLGVFFNKYKILIIFFIVNIFFLIFLSNIIFSINVVTNNMNLKNKIIIDLNNLGIKKYSMVKSYNETLKIKKYLLNKYKNNIEWLEIKRNGTNYTIQIVERKKSKKIKSKSFSNIVAKSDSIVKNIFVISGEALVEENTYVKKGDVLISGELKNNDEIKALVNSKGRVMGEVWYKVKIEYPLNYKEKKYTDDYKIVPYIKLANKYFELKKYKNYKREKLRSIKNRLIPFEVGIEKLNKIKYINQDLSIKEALVKAKKEAKNKLKNNLSKEESITYEKTLNFYEKNSKIIVEMFFSCYQNIGIEENIIE